MTYRVNSPQVISETVGGETIIVNLTRGHYFSLQGTAVDVWQSLERGEAPETIVLQLEQRYEAEAGEVSAAVHKLLDDFLAAELVVSNDNGGAPAAEPGSPPDAAAERVPFVTPSFTAFTDMQDIILLDPVHEVDTRGWPHASTGA